VVEKLRFENGKNGNYGNYVSGIGGILSMEFWNGFAECSSCSLVCVLVQGCEPIVKGVCPAAGRAFKSSARMPQTGVRCGACGGMYAVEGRFTGLNGRRYLRHCKACGQLSVISAVEQAEEGKRGN
jgi:hypothetical protein